MIRIKTKIRYENINKIRALIDGSPFTLNAISKIELRIPSLGIVITDETPSDYPIKWQHTPEDQGLIELKLGNVQSIIDSFIISSTGDIETDSEWISNIPAETINKLSKNMFVEGLILSVIPTIISINRSENKIKLSQKATSTASGTSLKFYEFIESSIHKADFYIFNVDYPDGFYWNSIEINLGL